MAAPIDYTPIRNTTDEVIPSGGLFRVTGIDADTGAFLVGLPDADDDGAVGVNGLGLIPAGAAGQGHFDPRAIAAYAAADGTPQPGEAWGVKAGDWRLRKGYAGFRVLAGVGLGLANVVRVPAGGGGGTGCAKLAGLRRDECVTFTVPAGYGVDPVTLTGTWSTSANGWVSSGTVQTSDGPTRLVLFNKAEGGKGLRLVGEERTWYGDDLGCLGTDREFAAAVTPPELEDDNSASGGTPGCCAGCDDHTFRVRVGCRPPGSQSASPPADLCVWVRQADGSWTSYDVLSPAAGFFLAGIDTDLTGSGAQVFTGTGYTGWEISALSIGLGGAPGYGLYSIQVWYDPAACGGQGGWVWNRVNYSESYGFAPSSAVNFEDPDDAGIIYSYGPVSSGPIDGADPWVMVVTDGIIIQACADTPPSETRYACVDGVCVPTPGGPYTEATCGGDCSEAGGGPTEDCGKGVGSPDVTLTVTGGDYAGAYTGTWNMGSNPIPYVLFLLEPIGQPLRQYAFEFYGGEWHLVGNNGGTVTDETATGGTCDPFSIAFAGSTIPGATSVVVAE